LSVERKEVAAADEDMNGGNEEEWMESLKKKPFRRKQQLILILPSIVHGEAESRVAKFFLDNIPKRVNIYQSTINTPNGNKIYQMATKYTKWQQNIPNGRKIDPTIIERTNIFCCHQNPKFTQIGNFGLKIYRLATLVESRFVRDGNEQETVLLARSVKTMSQLSLPSHRYRCFRRRG
jgi:hypothetical protein